MVGAETGTRLLCWTAPSENSVNLPDVILPRRSRCRVAIANANVPNMVGGISHEMAAGPGSISRPADEQSPRDLGVHAGGRGQRRADSVIRRSVLSTAC